MATDSVAEHKKERISVGFAVISISSTRSIEQDGAGDTLENLITDAGHCCLFRVIVKDSITEIQRAVQKALSKNDVGAVVTTGGTGLARLDVTIEAVKPLFEKEMSSFAALMSLLSYKEIGSAAVMSRTCAGLIGGKVVFCLPGSPKACTLAMKSIILEEISHIITHSR